MAGPTALRSKGKGRVVRGLCCSDGGVFKPDERETYGRLSNDVWYVNAKTFRRSNTNPPQILVAYMTHEILTPADSHPIEPCECHGRDQVAFRPYFCYRAWQRGMAQSMMEGENRIRSRRAERNNGDETRTTWMVRRNHNDRANLGDFRSDSSVKIADKHHPSLRVEGNRHRR